LAGSGRERLVSEDTLEENFVGECELTGEDRARAILAHSDRARRRSTLRFMKLSSDLVTEVVLPQAARRKLASAAGIEASG